MGNHDRAEPAMFHRLSDDPSPIDECNYIGCRRPIYKDEKNWELFGTWFCSSVCVARHVDAKRTYPDQIQDSHH